MNTKAKLTSAEISNLWSTYVNDTVTECLLTHFKETLENQDFLPYIEEGISIARSHLDKIRNLFQKEGMLIPSGFPVEKHVVPNAPKLFSDIFCLEYLRHMCKVGIGSHGTAITLSPREDVRLMYQDFLQEAVELNNRTMKYMEQIGVFIRTPSMHYPKEKIIVEKQNFLTGYFGRRRPLLAVEVTHLTTSGLHNVLGQTTCLAFAQVTNDEELSHYFLRGKRISSDILGHTHDILTQSDVPNPITWDADITDSRSAPFSDQLMLFIIGTLSNVGVSLYGAALGISMRHDIGILYADFIRKAAAYGEDGLNLQIERAWLEQPPQFIDHEKLATEK